MKKLLLLVACILPLCLAAQTDCDFFKDASVSIEKTQINTTNSDYGPSFVNGELWFSSFTADEIRKLANGATKNVFYNSHLFRPLTKMEILLVKK